MKYWQRLEELKKKGPRFKDYGICENVEFEHDILGKLYDTSWFGWKKFSGSRTCPVPHEDFPAFNAYQKYRLWSKRTQYGRDRWELVNHLITEFKKRDL